MYETMHVVEETVSSIISETIEEFIPRRGFVCISLSISYDLYRL